MGIQRLVLLTIYHVFLEKVGYTTKPLQSGAFTNLNSAQRQLRAPESGFTWTEVDGRLDS
jgi:hypothetical protein